MRIEAKLLYRRLDSLFGALDPRRPAARLPASFPEESSQTLADCLRLPATLHYWGGRHGVGLRQRVGEPCGAVRVTLDAADPALALVFQHRVYIFSDPNAEASPARRGLFPPGASAAILAGRRPKRHVLFFLLKEGWVLEELDFVLNT